MNFDVFEDVCGILGSFGIVVVSWKWNGNCGLDGRRIGWMEDHMRRSEIARHAYLGSGDVRTTKA